MAAINFTLSFGPELAILEGKRLVGFAGDVEVVRDNDDGGSFGA